MFELLNSTHDRTAFDCGNVQINQYLQTMASQHHKKGIASVHVLVNGEQIKAFFTLSAISLDNTNNAIKGYPKQIPAVLIGRLGVDVAYQGQQLGDLLLSEALRFAKEIKKMAGVAFVVIDAKNESLANYYQKKGFYRFANSLKLFYPVNNVD